MAKLVIELSPTDTGKVIGDLTWDFCAKIADGSAVSTTGATLTELGFGQYILNNPNVAADTAFRVHLTASSSHYASGVFSLADDNMALASADFNSAQKTSLNAATPASVQNIAAQTGDAYARVGAAGAGLTAIGDARLGNLDATVSSRLAPGGTLATVTNLTNAPTSGDFTATMKTSLSAATPMVTLATAQPNYAPAKAGDAMTLTGAYDAAKTAASQTSVNSIPTTPLLAADSRLDHLNADVSGVPGAVWDVTAAGHLSAGSTGASLAAAGSAGDPWTTTLPGGYGAGTAGSILGNRLDAAVSSRNATAPDNTSIASALSALNDGAHGLAALLTAINTRMAAFTYTAPDNADIAAARTDLENLTYGLAALHTALGSISATVDLSPVTSRLDNSTYGLAAILAAAGSGGSNLTAADIWSYIIASGQTAQDLVAKLYIPDYSGPVVVVPANTDPDVQFVHFYGKKGDITPASGRTVFAVPTPGQVQNQNLIAKEKLNGVLDEDGYCHLTLIRGIEYRVLASWWGDPFTFTVSSDGNRTFAAYVEDQLTGSAPPASPEGAMIGEVD